MPFAGVCGFTDAVAVLVATELEVIVPRIVPRQRLKPRLSGPLVLLRKGLLRIGLLSNRTQVRPPFRGQE